MTSILRSALVAAAGFALIAPGAADAATKTVYMGGIPTATKAQQKVFEDRSAEADDYFPRTVRVHTGDTVSFVAFGFHTVDLPRPGGTPLPLISPTNNRATNALDAAGAPFWFNGVAPVLSFTPQLLSSGFGKTRVYTGARAVNSGLPLSDNVRPARVRFTKAGAYRYYCNVHPGMVGTVRVVAKNRTVPSARANARASRIQFATALTNARRLPSTTGIPANTVSMGQQRGTVHRLGFSPNRLTVARGTTVTFDTPANSRDAHTVTFGPGDPTKDPRREPNNYLAKLAAPFQGPGPFDPLATYPSEAPTAPTAVLSPTLHGNGFWNTGVSGPPVTGLPPGGRVTFGTAGSYKFYCLIHPFMNGTITVQ